MQTTSLEEEKEEENTKRSGEKGRSEHNLQKTN